MGSITKHIINGIIFPIAEDVMSKSEYDVNNDGVVDVAQIANVPTYVDQLTSEYLVTHIFAIGENLKIDTGVGSAFGTSTPSGNYSTIMVGTNSIDFGTSKYKILLNGIDLQKGIDVVYVDKITLRFNIPLYQGDIVKIEGIQKV